MATGKRYYWMKLKESFMTSDTVDYLMSQPDGANYVVLYQMLCLKTINTNGRFSRQIGEMIIPYDIGKIKRDCKWFSIDTIRNALTLFKSFGLIYEEVDGTLVLSNYEEMVGSETDWGEKKRRQRNSELQSGDNSGDNVPLPVPENVPTDIRDKILDIRDEENRDEDTREQSDLLDSDESNCRADAQRVIDAWNELPLESKVQRMSKDSTRSKSLGARIREYGVEKVLEAVAMINNSDFLLGRKTEFQITFDWFVKPNNFSKVISGNYNNRQHSGSSAPASNPFLNMMAGDMTDGNQ